jgi:DNA polymerase III subunit delta
VTKGNACDTIELKRAQGGDMAASKTAGLADAAALKAHIKAGKPAPCYLFTGTEDFLIRQYHKEMVQFVLPSEAKDFNYIVFEGKSKTSAILDAAETFPVFAERKLLVIKESGFFKPSKTGDGLSENDKQAWKNYFDNMPEHTVLLFIEPEINKTLSMSKWLTKYGMVVDFNHPSDDMLIKWLMRLCAERGKIMTPAVAGRLLALGGRRHANLIPRNRKADAACLRAQGD